MKGIDVKRQVVEAAHLMSAKGLVGAYEGNISARLGDRMYLTPTGTSKEHLTEEQVIVTDLDGTLLEGSLAPTSETPMHSMCYKLREDVSAVVHCHAPYSTAFANAGAEVQIKTSTEFLLLFGKVPLLKYGTPGTLDLVSDLQEYVDEYDVFLLENHGMLAVGQTLMEAYSKTLSLEVTLKTEVIRQIISGSANNDIPDDECIKLIDKGRRNHGRSVTNT